MTKDHRVHAVRSAPTAAVMTNPAVETQRRRRHARCSRGARCSSWSQHSTLSGTWAALSGRVWPPACTWLRRRSRPGSRTGGTSGNGSSPQSSRLHTWLTRPPQRLGLWSGCRWLDSVFPCQDLLLFRCIIPEVMFQHFLCTVFTVTLTAEVEVWGMLSWRGCVCRQRPVGVSLSGINGHVFKWVWWAWLWVWHLVKQMSMFKWETNGCVCVGQMGVS